jgi:hypothetical protein
LPDRMHSPLLRDTVTTSPCSGGTLTPAPATTCIAAPSSDATCSAAPSLDAPAPPPPYCDATVGAVVPPVRPSRARRNGERQRRPWRGRHWAGDPLHPRLGSRGVSVVTVNLFCALIFGRFCGFICSLILVFGVLIVFLCSWHRMEIRLLSC